jgi:hypothetical protein
VSVGVLAAGGESVFYLLVDARPLSTAGLRVTATDRCVRRQNDLTTRTATSNSILETPVDRMATRCSVADPVDRRVKGELA